MKEKTLFIWPSVDFSIMDVAKGINKALKKQGLEIIDYHLSTRVKILYNGMKSFKPEDREIMFEDVSLYASEAIPYRIITNNTKHLFIVSGFGLHPNTVYAAKQLGCKITIWLTESPYNTDQECEIAQFADTIFVNERTSVKYLEEKLNKKVIYLAHAFDPEVHYPKLEIEKTKDLIFIGTGFLDRLFLLQGMDFEKVNFELGGIFSGLTEPNFLMKHLKYNALNNSEVVEKYHQTKILLNPHRWAEEAESANPRVFEGAACKIFQVSDYRKEIEEIFGDCIPMYTHGIPWEASGLVYRYLNDPETRFNMQEEAFKKVQPHNFDNRAKFIIEEVGFK